MSSALSPYRLRKARRVYNLFSVFNAFSFTMLTGNVITLYALRLGAGATEVGLLSAFGFVSFFFMPIGKRLAAKFAIVRVFGVSWLLRYLAMVPLLIAPFLAERGRLDAALILVSVGVFAFHLFRGVGMIANNPILHELASGSDRGSFVVQIQMINAAVSMLGNISLVFLLGRDPPLAVYGVIMAAGIVTGIAASVVVMKVPEPAESAENASAHFFGTLTRAFERPPFRLFMLVFFLASFVSSTSRAFSAVYGRDVYLSTDGDVALFSVFAALGALAIGMASRLLVDRVGAKPLYIVYTAAAGLAMLPPLFSPALGSSTASLVFLIVFHFAINFGFAGSEGMAQNYFFGLIRPEETLDLGILYYVVFGAAGAVGSFFGGVSLDLMAAAGYSPETSFRAFYGFLVALLAFAVFLQRDLVRLGALPLKGALGVIFSFKDLRALTLLNRLEKTTDPDEEAELLGALHETPSTVGASGLLERVRSPRLAIRLEAIRAIEALPELAPQVESALIADTEQNPYTTAYVSARVLGRGGSAKSVPLLRKTLASDDYMLAGESMLALARLRDQESLAAIEERMATTKNPRLLIMGVAAVELFGKESSLSCLLDLLRREAPPPYLRDEVVLAISGILGFLDRFYAAYIDYLDGSGGGTVLIADQIEASAERYGSKVRRHRAAAQRIEALKDAVGVYMERGDGIALSRWIHGAANPTGSVAVPLFAEAAVDADLSCFERFRFLLAFWASTKLEKELRNAKALDAN